MHMLMQLHLMVMFEKTSDTDEATSILEGCLTDWSWYTTDVQTDNFKLAPVYSYFNNQDSVVVLQKNQDDEIVAVKYSKKVAGDRVVSITDAVTLKPVLAGGIVLKAADLNNVVDFQYGGKFTIASAVAPKTVSPFLANAFTAKIIMTRISRVLILQ